MPERSSFSLCPAIGYYQQAGDLARERSAYAEAVAHLTRGLELLEHLDDARQRSRLEIALQLALGLSLQVTQGWGAPEVERAFVRSRELCREAGEVRELFPSLWNLWRHNHAVQDNAAARRLVEQLLRLAETTRESDLQLQAHHAAWTTEQVRGELVAAYEHTRAGRAIYRREEHHRLTQQFGNHDPGYCALIYEAVVLAQLGYPDQSAARTDQAIELAESLGHPFTRFQCRRIAMGISLTLRDPIGVAASVRAARAIAKELGEPPWATLGSLDSWLEGYALLHQHSEGIARMRTYVEAQISQPDNTIWEPLMILAEAYAAADRFDEGSALLEWGRVQLDAIGPHCIEADLHRVRGELLCRRSSEDFDEAEAAFRQALEVARRQRARLLELRAAVGLARLLEMRERKQDARALLTDSYGWFTEGFDAPDLKQAKALLDQLT